MILHLIGIVFQFDAIVIAAHVHEHDGHFAERNSCASGCDVRSVRQIHLGFIDGVFFTFLLGDLGFTSVSNSTTIRL